jgi:hypothetical protein
MTRKLISIMVFFTNETRIFRLAFLCILNGLIFRSLLLWSIMLSLYFSLFLTSRLQRLTSSGGLDHVNLRIFTRSSSRRRSVLSGSSRSILRVRLTRRFTHRVLGKKNHHTVSGVRFCRRYSNWISQWVRILQNQIK